MAVMAMLVGLGVVVVVVVAVEMLELVPLQMECWTGKRKARGEKSGT